ncbi:hypothetical protein GGS20DRAFT_597645 [Poronia punctata]|nr:hypothetical protein GGS20DRAFT_597645 [Poronia punctata]
MSSSRDPASRLRQNLNPLLTTALGYHNQLNTPQSAITTSSPHAFGATTPASSIQRYNPQEWIPSPAVGPERTHQYPPQPAFRDQPAPPPPYSPPRSQRQTPTNYETPPANTAAARIPSSGSHRPSPEPIAAQNFPPPPGSNERRTSRDRRFGLSSLTRRRDRDQPDSATSPDSRPLAPAVRPQPLMINVPQAVNFVDNVTPVLPPNSRRAASASAVETPISARARSASQSRWEQNLPLPPPPPGPPPSQSRSQSLNRPNDFNPPVASPPTRRPPPGGITALGPVPPTPANWVDEDSQQQPQQQQPQQQRASASSNQPELSLQTSNLGSPQAHGVPESATGASPNSGGGLNRTGAVRGEKTLRERRNESRPRDQRGESSASPQQLADIVVPQESTPRGRSSTHRGTPRSGGKAILELSKSLEDVDSRNSTPRASAGLPVESPTPPFSPRPQKSYGGTETGQAIAPKALPTPPPQSSRSASSSSYVRPDMFNSINSVASTPYTAQPLTKQLVVSQTAQQFCQGTVERLQVFAEKEASAKTDADRVKLFADFIVNESRLRRERYSSAIGAMGSEIFDLTRDLFRPMRVRRDSNSSQISDWAPQASETRSNRNSMNSGPREQPQPHSAPPSAGLPPSSSGPPAINTNWNSNQYMPSLSPILSMSVSARDEADSRGRPASRWWESESAGEGNRMERSKRESKYMGVPKEAREALQWEDASGSTPGPSGSSEGYLVDEYPAEKVGWHEPESAKAPHPFRQSLLSVASSAPNTPCPFQLDVSRLVTLPPPYPRHHPAVNNNHPELASMRALVRTISDLSEVEATKQAFAEDSQKAREKAVEEAAARRQALRVNLQQEIGSGNMSYAEAAAIEADSQESEKAQSKDLERKEFDRFQNAVVMPLNELLMARITRATSLFDELRSRLFVETQAPNPNMPQEEGDEQPELLEKLTLLKWIFEARENLHRENYSLLSDRNDRYREMVIMPYRLSGNEEKVRNAEAFFAEDAAKRQSAFVNEVLQRTREFRDVVGETVTRGVDMQLNAFWDIAPPLKRLLDKIPSSIDAHFHIQIPPAEYEENPAYHEHPMQYLYSLLLHAEKSTYQFIESQTNLLCLLHEVKEAAVSARAKVSEAEGHDAHTVEDERRGERDRLTDDLKEKVRVVQDQWEGALGDGMRGVKERVGEWLLSTGGWDESLEDGGVGGV